MSTQQLIFAVVYFALGAGLIFFGRWLVTVPIMPVGDPVFMALFENQGREP